jgi:aspartate kinase
MIVLKFGGTSVQNAEWINRAIDITDSQIKKSPVMVCSAMGKTTDRLVDIETCANNGDSSGAEKQLQQLKDAHFGTAQDFLTGETLVKASTRLHELFEEMSSLVKGLILLKECTPRSHDALLSFGELLSTTLIYYRALQRGIDAVFVDSRECITTDDHFTSAVPLLEETDKTIKNKITPQSGKLFIAQGFIARNKNGATTTLGRGGSDFSATLYGAALEAEEVQIWTDVNGIMTSDPRIVPGAYTIPRISYEEAAELAYFGAKVVHPSTIQPAVEKNIPVVVKNTRNVDGDFSTITVSAAEKGLRAIAGKKNITLINISSSRMLNAYGFLKRIFAIFDTYKTPVDLIATSEVSVSMTIDNPSAIDAIVRELEEIGIVTIEQNRSMICLVGKDFWKDSQFVARVFSSLAPTQVRMISLGSSDINLSLVVQEEQFESSIQKLHSEFF